MKKSFDNHLTKIYTMSLKKYILINVFLVNIPLTLIFSILFNSKENSLSLLFLVSCSILISIVYSILRYKFCKSLKEKKLSFSQIRTSFIIQGIIGFGFFISLFNIKPKAPLYLNISFFLLFSIIEGALFGISMFYCLKKYLSLYIDKEL